jgi:hypothetical protein
MLDELYQPFMVDGIEGNHDTLPTSTVILKALKYYATGTHCKDNPCKFSAGHTEMEH